MTAPKDRLGGKARRLALELGFGLTEHFDAKVAEIRAALETVVRDCVREASQPCEEPSMSATPWSHHVDAAAAILRHWGLEAKP